MISIIVPVYNVEKYINKCIDSLINQTYKDLEIILVDDGSTDSSGKICDEYKKKDKRIKVIHKINGGLSSARNEGIKIAKGNYLGFVDSDDYVNIKMYEILMDCAKEYELDIVQCKFNWFNDEDEIKKEKNERINLIQCKGIESLRKLYNKDYTENIVVWNKIYRKELFDDIIFPVGKINEDEFTTYKLFGKCNKVGYIEDKLYNYRKTPNSITNSKFSGKKIDILDALIERKNYFKNKDENDLYIKTVEYSLIHIINRYYECYNSNCNNKKELLTCIYRYIKYINDEIKYCGKYTNIKYKLFKRFPKLYCKLILVKTSLNN